MAKAIRRAAAWLLDLLFPSGVTCLCCGYALGEEGQDGVCPACIKALERLEGQTEANREPLPEGIDSLFSAYPYKAQARTLILKLKYEHVRAAAIPLGRVMALLPGGEADLLVPVPTTKGRLKKRGFNQAQLLCEVIAGETGMPMRAAISRRDERRSQTFLSGQSRRKNLEGCMQAEPFVRGQRIILVDDVYTTGSTAGEAARALRAQGAVQVSVFTAARSLSKAEKKKEKMLPF